MLSGPQAAAVIEPLVPTFVAENAHITRRPLAEGGEIMGEPGRALVASGCTTLKTPTFADDGGAIRGYDTVAYFTQGEPVPGDAAYSTIYNDATWHFSSAENLAGYVASQLLERLGERLPGVRPSAVRCRRSTASS